jgi:hypothetical protein
MIEQTKVEQIQRMLTDERLSQRKIAKLTGVSRATVAGVADGSRPDYSARQVERQTLLDEPTGPPVRCPGCGGRVYAPCRLCRVRRLKEEARTQAPIAPRRPRPIAAGQPIASGHVAGCEADAPSMALAAADSR